MNSRVVHIKELEGKAIKFQRVALIISRPMHDKAIMFSKINRLLYHLRKVGFNNL